MNKNYEKGIEKDKKKYPYSYTTKPQDEFNPELLDPDYIEKNHPEKYKKIRKEELKIERQQQEEREWIESTQRHLRAWKNEAKKIENEIRNFITNNHSKNPHSSNYKNLINIFYITPDDKQYEDFYYCESGEFETSYMNLLFEKFKQNISIEIIKELKEESEIITNVLEKIIKSDGMFYKKEPYPYLPSELFPFSFYPYLFVCILKNLNYTLFQKLQLNIQTNFPYFYSEINEELQKIKNTPEDFFTLYKYIENEDYEKRKENDDEIY